MFLRGKHFTVLLQLLTDRPRDKVSHCAGILLQVHWLDRDNVKCFMTSLHIVLWYFHICLSTVDLLQEKTECDNVRFPPMLLRKGVCVERGWTSPARVFQPLPRRAWGLKTLRRRYLEDPASTGFSCDICVVIGPLSEQHKVLYGHGP